MDVGNLLEFKSDLLGDGEGDSLCDDKKVCVVFERKGKFLAQGFSLGGEHVLNEAVEGEKGETESLAALLVLSAEAAVVEEEDHQQLADYGGEQTLG